MVDFFDTGQDNFNIDFFETTLHQQLIIKNEGKIFKNDISQKLFEYNNEIRYKEFHDACEQARQSFCVFRTKFLYKNKLIQIVEEYDPSIEIVGYIDIEKEQKKIVKKFIKVLY